jgi:hypothetical protein
LTAQASIKVCTLNNIFLYSSKSGNQFLSFFIFKQITLFQASLNSAETTFSESTGVFANATIEGGTSILQDQSLHL